MLQNHKMIMKVYYKFISKCLS